FRLWNRAIINVNCRLEDPTTQVNYHPWHYGTTRKPTLVDCWVWGRTISLVDYKSTRNTSSQNMATMTSTAGACIWVEVNHVSSTWNPTEYWKARMQIEEQTSDDDNMGLLKLWIPLPLTDESEDVQRMAPDTTHYDLNGTKYNMPNGYIETMKYCLDLETRENNNMLCESIVHHNQKIELILLEKDKTTDNWIETDAYSEVVLLNVTDTAVTLLGDPCQLGPCVISEEAEGLGYGQI
uniref:Uncharacterized protein n=1 Tax=Romanomermis culicivorax TaxID=13658 RepID=A0A915ITV1_ROMCU